MDQLELRRITFYPGVHVADIVMLVANFSMPAGLRVAEAAISSKQVWICILSLVCVCMCVCALLNKLKSSFC